jgi:hypothetical protein
MFRPMNLRPLVGVWIAVLVASAALRSFEPESTSTGIPALLFAACLVSASMLITVWRAGPAVTLATNLHKPRRRHFNELIRGRLERASDRDDNRV